MQMTDCCVPYLRKTMAPGEMENIILMKKDMVREDGTAVGSIRITVEEGKEM